MTSPPANAADKPDQPKRPWYRPHRSTYVVLTLTAIVLVLLIVPGELAEMHSPGAVVVRHGWPWEFYAHRAVSPVNPFWASRAPWRTTEGWRFSPAIAPFRLSVLALDTLVGAMIFAVVGSIYECWRRRRYRPWQFSLREVFAVTLVVAAIGSWYRVNRNRADREQEIDEICQSHSAAARAYFSYGYCGPVWLSRLVGEEYLDLQLRITELHATFAESLDGVRPYLAELVFLNEADLSGCSVRDADLDVVAELPRLRILSLASDRLSNAALSYLAKSQSVEELDLNSTNVTDEGLKRLARLPRLRELNLEDTGVTGNGLRYLHAIGSLEVLTVSNVDEDCFEAIGGLTSLRTLGINCEFGPAELPDTCVEHLRKLPKLNYLVLRGRVKPELRERLRRALPNCKIDNAL